MEKNNGGYISAISLLIMAFLLLLTGAVVPRVRAELNFASINSDGVEAQYAAEAGVKYAAAQILDNPGNTDWGWARGDQELTFADGETYKITIYPIDSDGNPGSSPIDDGVALTSGRYLIKSEGKVNDYFKTVKVIAYVNTGSTSAPAIYSGKTLSASGSLKVANGDILADTVDLNGNVTINEKNKILYYNNASVPHYSNIETKKWSGEKYTYQPDESVITSLPSFSAEDNINGYTNNYSSGVSLSAPDNQNGITTYTLDANTKYYLSSGMPSPKNKGTLKFSKTDNGDVTMTIAGNYTSSKTGNGTSINLTGTGNFVLNILGNMTAQSFTINATNASSVTINATGSITTNGSGITIHGPANGNVNINAGADFSIGSGGLTIDGVNTGNINIAVDSDLTTDGYSWHISRPVSGDVNILVNGNFSAKGRGLPITGISTGTVNFFVGGTLNTQGSGIVIDSTTGNVNIYVNSNLSASGSGMSVDGANVNIVAKGDISFSGNNSLRGDNVLLYAIGEGHDVEANSLYIEGVIIAPDGDITLVGGTIINNSNTTTGTGGTGSGTGTIDFNNWSS